MAAPFEDGSVGHFGLAVRDVRRSADWYIDNLGFREAFAYDGGIAIETDGVTVVLHPGPPDPAGLDHISFHLPDMKTLRVALAHLKGRGIPLEDPGDEIGPEAPGSPHLALWLRDPDGYRLELSVQNGAAES